MEFESLTFPANFLYFDVETGNRNKDMIQTIVFEHGLDCQFDKSTIFMRPDFCGGDFQDNWLSLVKCKGKYIKKSWYKLWPEGSYAL